MQLPHDLQQAIESALYGIPQKELMAANAALTERYRGGIVKNNFMSSHIQRMAYIAVRMPATFAAVCNVLNEIKKRIPDLDVKSLLDLGAGPGTVLWAACQIFDGLADATMIEQDQDLIAIGQSFLKSFPFKTVWQKENLQAGFECRRHDLVTLSYAINELSDADKIKTIQSAWQKTNHIMVIIEPGTKAGYRNILLARDELIKLDAHIVAPCPHALTCSMIAKPLTPDDWCHFPARIERSAIHRQIKSADLSFEDEKFSYIAVSRQPVNLPTARTVRHPQIQKGHIDLTLCVKQHIEKKTVSRKDKNNYQRAKKTRWGNEYY